MEPQLSVFKGNLDSNWKTREVGGNTVV